jgi:uncharacterized protein YdeI (YjbR/CyaY-like superfamily)
MARAEEKNGESVLPFVDGAAFGAWLAKHHATEKALWLKIAKKGSGHRSLDYAAALDEALCWGWIDAVKGAWDDAWFVQRFTPRGPRSRWSKINVQHVARLINAGRMQPTGQAAIDHAKKTGAWDQAYDGAKNIQPSAELLAALEKAPKARALFEALDSANRFAILYRTQSAKKAETRARAVEKFVAMLARGETPYPLKKAKAPKTEKPASARRG